MNRRAEKLINVRGGNSKPFADFNRDLMTMKTKKRSEVVWEKHETTTISFNRNRRAKTFCPACGSDELHLTVAEVAALFSTTARKIFRLIEAGEIHYLETESGALLICGNSCQNRRKQASDKFEPGNGSL
jgi:hypothetical protein